MKKVLSFVMVVSMMLSLSACRNSAVGTSEMEPDGAEVVNNIQDEPEVEVVEEDVYGVKFSNDVIDFIRASHPTENFMVSPLSLKLALALATLGATDETRDELLNAVGVGSIENYMNWASKINTVADLESEEYLEDLSWAAQFENEFNTDTASNSEDLDISSNNIEVLSADTDEFKKPMVLANSIWYNTTNNLASLTSITDSYKQLASEYLKADAFDLPGVEMQSAVNEWVSDNTYGLIPSVLDSEVTEDVCLMLVNTLYIKAAWAREMLEIGEQDFTNIDGEVVSKEFISGEATYGYFKDDNTELVVLPIGKSYNLQAVVVIGDTDNVLDKVQLAEGQKVHVRMPKMDVDSSFSDELTDFLKFKGVIKAFVPGEATFGEMMTDPTSVYIGKIIQKTKLGLDENGIEAAAATAITMMTNSMIMEPEEVIEFVANKPFSLYILSDIPEEDMEEQSSQEILFYTNYVR